MKEIVEKIWDEYFSEQCAEIKTSEERALLQKASELHTAANRLLTAEQMQAVEKYVESLFELQGYITKRSFFKGCSFAVSFFFETERNLE